jgi:hypothetical protein
LDLPEEKYVFKPRIHDESFLDEPEERLHIVENPVYTPPHHEEV